ncbi:unnamed protein product [Nippostrongylus brasiliensis]|uniref:Aldedh domain-containing protein n=1 Tax=Nippostrongylus brasiliensis TaxID=27835 RepID=A0A0N4Y4A3_NIPBR|nr:unnamed protein product [Nippostrongylus brasiliensis]
MALVGKSRVAREKKEELVRASATGLDEVAAILKIDDGAQLEVEPCWGDAKAQRNGEIVAEICEMLNTDVLQVKDGIAALREAVNAEKRWIKAGCIPIRRVSNLPIEELTCYRAGSVQLDSSMPEFGSGLR